MIASFLTRNDAARNSGRFREGSDSDLGEQVGGVGLDQGGEVVGGVGDFGGEVVDTAGEPAQGEFGGPGWAGDIAGAQRGAGGDLLGAGQRLQLGAKLQRGGDDHLMQRVDCCGGACQVFCVRQLVLVIGGG